MHLKFKTVHVTKNNNLLLEPVAHNEPITRKTLFLRGKKAAQVFDTIAAINNPLYLAKPLQETKAGEILQGEK
ncbi:hypothetical protein HY571_02395 [Candidatus Micrarchaeota archaeon]|nr:hypothetical protein [Candidatus Micrarchaeota archaeon]